MPRTISPFASPDLRSSRDLLSESLLAHHQHAFQPRRAMSDSWALWKGPSDWGKELGESLPEDGDISSPLSTRDFSRTLTMLGIETPDDFDFGGGPCGEIDDSSGPKGVRAARAPIFRGRIGRVVMAEMVGGLGNWGWVWVRWFWVGLVPFRYAFSDSARSMYRSLLRSLTPGAVFGHLRGSCAHCRDRGRHSNIVRLRPICFGDARWAVRACTCEGPARARRTDPLTSCGGAGACAEPFRRDVVRLNHL